MDGSSLPEPPRREEPSHLRLFSKAVASNKPANAAHTQQPPANPFTRSTNVAAKSVDASAVTSASSAQPSAPAAGAVSAAGVRAPAFDSSAAIGGSAARGSSAATMEQLHTEPHAKRHKSNGPDEDDAGELKVFAGSLSLTQQFITQQLGFNRSGRCTCLYASSGQLRAGSGELAQESSPSGGWVEAKSGKGVGVAVAPPL